jgi:hypothetical protein
MNPGYGVFGAVNVNSHSADFHALPGVPSCCPDYSDGDGLGLGLGLLYEIPLSLRLSLSLRASYAAHDGLLQSQEATTVSVGGVPTPAVIEHSLDATLTTVGIEQIAGYRVFADLYVNAGGRLGFVLGKTFNQKEILLEPAGGTFENGLRTRNIQNGDIPDAAALRTSLIAGISYRLPMDVDGSLILVPELLFEYGASSLVSGLDWSVNTVRAGVSVIYSPKPDERSTRPSLPFEAPPVPTHDPVIARRNDRTIPKIRIYGFAPELAIISQDSIGDLILTQKSTLVVRGIATDSSGVGIVRLNGTDATVTPGVNGVLFSSEPVLVFGDNLIIVEAIDRYSNIARDTLRVRRIPEREAGRPQGNEIAGLSRGKVWAVVVGISKYRDDDIQSLNFADRDALGFYGWLTKPIADGGRGVPSENIRMLLNEEATNRNLREALFDFPKASVDDDIFMLYFAGHGEVDPLKKDQFYFLPCDADRSSLGATAIRQTEIQDAISGYIGANRVLVFIDACHGSGVSNRLTIRGNIDSTDIRRFLYDVAHAKPGVLLFSASEVNQVSYEDERWGGGHGVFTHYLMEGLNGKADRDRDSYVRLGELLDFVEDNVRRETKNTQHPMRKESGGYDRELPMSIVRSEKE